MSATSWFVILLGLTGSPVAQEPAQGLTVSFTSLANSKADALLRDDRVARRLALVVSRGEPPTQFMAPGPFRAEWRGELLIGRRDRYRFSYTGRGRFELLIDGQSVLTSDGGKHERVSSEEIRLESGSHVLVARYQSSLSGRAAMRVEWECRVFAREGIPIEFLRHDETQSVLREGIERRRGMQLFVERRCISCHADVNAKGQAMHDLDLGAPALQGIGDRLETAWMAEWIADPRAMRDGVRMPHMLRGSPAEIRQQAVDLATYLASHHGDEAIEAVAGDSTAGGMLFAELGCIACHEFALDSEPPTISLGRVGAKFRSGALAAFLIDPTAHDPWSRMPEFGFSGEEAANLAAFLREHSARAEPTPKGDADRGAGIVAEIGCLRCHEPEMDFVYAAPDLVEILAGSFARGCLAVEASQGAAVPDFGFAAADRVALQAFAATGMHALRRHNRTEFAARQIQEHRCTACHSYDGRVDRWTEREHLLVDLNIEARPRPDPDVSQFRPNLSVLGERLQVSWMQPFLAGKTASPRPWMRARMPVFANIAADMALGLAASHGFTAASEPHDLGASLAHDGRKLVGAAGGFACTACHGIAGQPPTSVFEVQGIDLALSADRLRHEYFLRWMLDPPRIEPAAKMPKFADDRGRTPFREVCQGDARRQFQAIWVYLESLR